VLYSLKRLSEIRFNQKLIQYFGIVSFLLRDIPALPFIQKFRAGVKNLKIKKIIAFKKHLPELFTYLFIFTKIKVHFFT